MNLNGFPEFKCKYQISVNLWGFFSLLGRGCFLSRDGERRGHLLHCAPRLRTNDWLERETCSQPRGSSRDFPGNAVPLGAGTAYGGQGSLMCHMTLGI